MIYQTLASLLPIEYSVGEQAPLLRSDSLYRVLQAHHETGVGSEGRVSDACVAAHAEETQPTPPPQEIGKSRR